MKVLWYRHILIFTVLLLISVQYKVDNAEALRPLYTIGLIVIGLVNLLMYLRYSAKYILWPFYLSPGGILLYVTLFYMMFSSILAGERQIKDAIYLIFWISTVPLVIMFLSKKKGLSHDLYILSRAIIIFATFACIIAYLTIARVIDFEYGAYALKQNYWTAFRIHGFMGQPTALGSLIGVALILLTYIKSTDTNKKHRIVFIFLFLSILTSGSRNCLVSILVVFIATSLIKSKMKTLIYYTALSSISLTLLFISSPYLFSLFDRGDYGIGAENSRIYIWTEVCALISENTIISLFFGNGSGALSNTFRAAFNTPLHMLYDYGVIGMSLYLLSFLYSLYIGVERYMNTKHNYYILGINLLIYGFVFNLFISSFISPFFSFHVLSFVLGIIIVNTKPKNLMVEKCKIIPANKFSSAS
jgi:hypothetical protein